MNYNVPVKIYLQIVWSWKKNLDILLYYILVNICAYPHILKGNLSSCVALHPSPSNKLSHWKKCFFKAWSGEPVPDVLYPTHPGILLQET
jgi:hypothetical protein